jgi:hypothetical protein
MIILITYKQEIGCLSICERKQLKESNSIHIPI